ncbi:hypothetical protein P6F28_13910 [Roseicyclus marinus]|uniref:hypothetical protein n=1 Tax=Roseicyclus marinus TaxID=2161673 RepID=UPI0024104930|nr:hypothetical protein [Roseicyclus marinus]MDG3042381.1 hypothetical protein [Roseicyclus marinus]
MLGKLVLLKMALCGGDPPPLASVPSRQRRFRRSTADDRTAAGLAPLPGLT